MHELDRALAIPIQRDVFPRPRERAFFPLIEKVAGLLPMLEIDVDANPIFRREGISDRLARKNPDSIIEALLLPHRAMTPLDNRARTYQLRERCDDRLAHPIGA